MFPIRQVIKRSPKVLQTCRHMSSAKMVDISDDEGIAVLTLHLEPVNSLNLEFLQEINRSLDDIAKNKPKGLILTSAFPNVFSAGVDITEVHKPDLKRVEQFSKAHQDSWIKLFGFPFATAAAINGHCPAGGCLMAMCCEHRAMVAGKYRIGLNEVALGIIANEWFMDTMRYTVYTTRDAELALTTGKLFSVDEALEVGLIDEVASDKADAIEKCKQFIKKFDKILPLARTTSKLRIRQELLDKMHRNRHLDTAEMLEYIQRPEVQQALDIYMKNLKAAKKSN